MILKTDNVRQTVTLGKLLHPIRHGVRVHGQAVRGIVLTFVNHFLGQKEGRLSKPSFLTL